VIRPLIKEQLEKCQFANLNNYDPATNTFIIKRYSQPTYDINKCYLVRLPTTIIDNNDSVLAVNWNNGTAPKTQYLKIYVSKTLGNMIYVDSAGFDVETKQDLNTMWSGWLNTSELTQIASL
jgi:hypothetical protein